MQTERQPLQPLWRPTPERAARSRMHEFMVQAAARYGFPADWPSLHRWSVTHGDQFWREMWEFAEIRASAPPTAVAVGEGMLGTKWFPGLTFNFAEHLLRFNDDRVAIEAEDELGRTRSITYRELRAEVARCAAALRAAGIERGDRIGGFLPNIPEAVVAMLATASLGAIWSSCSPDFGIAGVFDRFGQIQPRVLFAADGYSYNGKRVDSVERIRGVVERIPSIERVVVVPFLDPEPALNGLRSAALWDDFLSGRGTARARSADAEAQLTFEQLPFDHPLYIMYSSGTTGVPKCIVHGAGGTLLQHMKELMLHTDLRREDTILYFTTCGWMMWNWLVSALGVGATVVLYEGSPSYPSIDHLWQLAERLGITVFGTSAKFIAACQTAGIKPGAGHDLRALRAVLSTGSPLTIENFHWVYDRVKADHMLASICGGTDIISCFMLGNPLLPVYAGEIQCLGLGMDVHAFDADGRPAIGTKGELVCVSPFPSQPTGFWNDPDGRKYRRAYFEHFPGVWRHGDFVGITERGGVIVYGRSDATLNPGGVRIGTAEIYRQVESMEEIVDSVVVGKNTPDADVEICLFVVLREGLKLDDALTSRIKQRVAEGATRRHVPKHIRQVSAVPYTISGKKVELAVAQTIHGEPVLNRDALANPQALEQYVGIV
ncbi:MAG: acetoacetate--CoA ligase [Planctomycetes bacterium]|nr:acetoacetate--CoA ligase [Planctomycetota bacterium]